MWKKVLIITATLDFGGAERVVVDVAKTLNKNNHYDPAVCSLLGGGDLETEIIDTGIKHYFLNLKSIKNVFKNLMAVRRIIKEYRPDIIQTSQSTADFYGSVGALGLKIPIISFVHNPDMPRPISRKIIGYIVNTLLINTFIVSTEEKAETLRGSVPFSKNKIRVLYTVIDPKNLELPKDFTKKDYKEKFFIPKNKFIIGSVGRFYWEKGYDLLITAFEKVLEKHPESFLVLVGDGPEFEKLKGLASNLGIADKVLFPGYRKNVAVWMSLFDVFVVSSKLEAFPLVSLEALGLGRPVIITDRLFSKKILERAAMVVPCSVEGLRDGILKLIEGPKLRKEMSEKGRKMIEEDFVIDKYVRKLEKIYNEVLNKKA